MKKPKPGCPRQGLRKTPPKITAEAQEVTASTISRIMLTFVGVAIFCFLSLFTPDIALLVGNERINVPFAGPVSFLGFIIVGPAVMIVLQIYLQIYIEHWWWLESIRQRLPEITRTPILVPLQNPLLRGFTSFVIYLLLPLMMLAFTWKTAVLSGWVPDLLGVTAATVVAHCMLPLPWSWRRKLPPSLVPGVAALGLAAVGVVREEALLHRPFALFRADLSNQWLPYKDLRWANLILADLTRVTLWRSDLSDAYLALANLRDASLSKADNLLQEQLDSACGDKGTKLLASLKIVRSVSKQRECIVDR